MKNLFNFCLWKCESVKVFIVQRSLLIKWVSEAGSDRLLLDLNRMLPALQLLFIDMVNLSVYQVKTE